MKREREMLERAKLHHFDEKDELREAETSLSEYEKLENGGVWTTGDKLKGGLIKAIEQLKLKATTSGEEYHKKIV